MEEMVINNAGDKSLCISVTDTSERSILASHCGRDRDAHIIDSHRTVSGANWSRGLT